MLSLILLTVWLGAALFAWPLAVRRVAENAPVSGKLDSFDYCAVGFFGTFLALAWPVMFGFVLLGKAAKLVVDRK